MKVQETFDHLKILLKQEKEEDLRQYREKMLNTSLEQRKKSGVCWHPVVVRQQKYGLGERLMVELEKTDGKKQDHLFQSGRMVSLFAQTADEPDKVPQANGVINFVQGNRMMITLNVDEFPNELKKVRLGVNLLFDETSYREMEKVIKEVKTLSHPRAAQLRDIILGLEEARFSEVDSLIDDELNPSQLKALNLAHVSKDVALIHGPPGTGKTTTMVKVIENAVKSEKQVLVCAPSNAAVDLIVEKLDAKGVKVMRMGHPARITDQILSRTYDAQFTQHEFYHDLKRLRIKAEEFFKMANKYDTKVSRSERYQRKLIKEEAHRYKADAEQLEFYISNSILNGVQVIACTLVGASHYLIRNRRYSTVFIDEAAQALEPACWIPIIRADKVVLAGDHCQLPPTIKSYQAAKAGLEITLFEKLMKRKELGQMLQVQYRMNSVIMGFSAQYFYDGELFPDEAVEDWQLKADEAPLEYIDTAGGGMEEEVEDESLSKFNPGESQIMLTRLEQLIADLGVEYCKEKSLSIGIISPYKAQVRKMEEDIKDFRRYPLLHDLKGQWSINSIDAFQGQERDIIAMSMVRSNNQNEIGFLADERRMNVGLTRARKKLLVIGDSATIGAHPFYKAWLNYVEAKGQYRSVYEIDQSVNE